MPGDANNSGGIEDEHDLTITDDDAYNISIEKLTDGEENDAATGDATFRVFVEGGTNPTTITGDITWTGGAGNGATPGVDFDDAVTSFSFGPGTITQTINLSTGQAAYDDMLLEGTETIIGTISNLNAASGLAVTASATDTAFIADDEVTGILISIDTVGNEGTREEGSATPLSFRIALDNGVVNNSGSSIDGTIDYSGGTATPGGGDDFIPVTTFSISDGTNFVDIDISALSDNIVENTETVVPEITLTNGIGTVNPTGNTATAYITDEDTAGLTISIAVAGGLIGVTEGNVTTIDYVVSLSDSKINGTGSDITGTVDFTGSATNLLDYNANAVPNFIIPNGSNSNTYSIILVDDMTSESTDTLNAEIVTTSIGSPLGSNLVTIDIFDDDSGLTIVEIGSPTDTTESPIGSPFVSFEISIAAGGAAASDITGTIAYGTSPGAATAGSDFTAITSYTIPAGQLSTTINVPVLDDPLIEPSEFVIANLTGNPSLGNYGNSSSSATIFDDDAANIQIVIDTVMSGAEGGQNAQFVVSIFGNLTNGTASSIFGNVIYGGNATSGDFTAIGGYDIGVGESADTITAFITDDVLLEFTDSIYAIVTSSSIGSVLVDSALAFIYDNDLDSISISIQTPVDGVEGAPAAEVSFTIIIDDGYVNGLGVPLTGDLLFTGTAAAGFDFSDFNDYSIPDGATFFIRSLPILDDQNLEQQELVIATLDNPLIPGAHNPALITDTAYIDDDDLSGALLEITGTFDGVESPGLPIDGEFSVGFVGGLVNQTGSSISGTITLAGTATEGAGNDYIGTTTFLIDDGSAEDIILIPIEDDLIEESEETVIATISTTGSISLGPDSVATIKILDDESDQDNDGLPDIVDPDIDLYGPTIWNIDSDCDGIFDGCDVDADGDGVDDDGGIDRNGDGIDDAFYDVGAIDSDGDGIKDTCDADLYGPDSNGDGLSDLLWDPSDLDEDLLPDHVDPIENNPDSDNDNWPDGADYHIYGNLYNGCDADNDGIHDVADSDDNPQDGITDVGNQDSNGNGIDNDWDTSRDDEMLINYLVTPNGDGENDVLSIQGVQFIDNHELIIFNRWGTPIYRSSEYTNNWAGEIDEGVNTGAEVLGDGTYFYTLNLGDQDGDGENDGVVRGYIEIRR